MATIRVILGTCLVASLLFSIQPAAAATYPLILRGKVTMQDGSPPPFTAGIERICSDYQGSAPGPTTSKKGEYIWRMDVDPLRTRSCVIRATHPGYVSTSIDISALDGSTTTQVTLGPLVLTGQVADPYAVISSDSNVPSKARSAWKAAMKALDNGSIPDAAVQMQAAVTAAPKFAVGWHALGVAQERMDKLTEARDDYQHAIDADSKMFPAYVTLARLCLKTKDWQGAANAADALIKADKKKTFTEIYLHQAVARYELKDLDGAEASAQEAIHRDSDHLIPRAEYVLGRILEAKGDAAGAREHISKYLDMDKKAPDADKIRTELQNLGKPGAAGAAPELEVL